MAVDKIKVSLKQLADKNLLRIRKTLDSAQGVRVRINNKEFLNFTSNDYLGIANHPQVKVAMIKGVKKYGVGSGASHLISGHQAPHRELELKLADFFDTEKALIFSSGFMANLGIIDALGTRDTVLLQNKLNHASLIDAGRLAWARSKRYPHNDVKALAKFLTEAKEEQAIIVSDAVFSMDGDVADIKSLVELQKKHQAWLMLDEAHSFGVLGKNGTGLSAGYKGSKSIIMATMGKALGTYGAVVAGSCDLIEYLLQKARTYIYTTAMPAAVASASMVALEILSKANDKREHLQELIKRFKANMQNADVELMPSNTPIQPLILNSNQQALEVADRLYKKSFLVQAVRPPAVASPRLRITFSAAHTLDQVDDLSSELKSAL